jgi:hypothetical protein
MKERHKEGREGMGKRRTFWWRIKLVDKYREQFADNPPLELHLLREREDNGLHRKARVIISQFFLPPMKPRQ